MEEWFSRFFQNLQLQLGLRDPKLTAPEKNISGIHGREWEYDIALFGYNHIMTDVDAAAGLGQLDRMKELYSAREALTKLYYLNLPGSVEAALQHFGKDYTSSMHLFPIRIPGAGENERNRVFASLLDDGIACNVHYKPLPMMTAYKALGFDIEDYPNAYDMYRNEVTLPLHTRLTDEDIDYVLTNFTEILSK